MDMTTAVRTETNPPGRILLVEDQDTVRLLAGEYLRGLGHQVVDSANGEEALAQLQQAPFQILFADITLPGMSGVDLAREARRLWPQIAVILTSGYDCQAEIVGIDGVVFLIKPYDLAALDRVLAEVLVSLRPRAMV